VQLSSDDEGTAQGAVIPAPREQPFRNPCSAG
jgi:hypothetical protein